nr:hypothetical protein [Tanacetum cinerariifolium]
MTLASYAKNPSKTFDVLMITPIDLSTFIMNGLNISNLTQETLLGLAFRLLKGTRSNYAELEYDFEECYEALSKKLNWENPEGDHYPFDLTKPLPLVMIGNRQKPEEPEFEVTNSDMPHDQEENLCTDDEEPKEKVASKCDWFTKPTQPQEPTDPDWNYGKTLQQGQNQSWLNDSCILC